MRQCRRRWPASRSRPRRCAGARDYARAAPCRAIPPTAAWTSPRPRRRRSRRFQATMPRAGRVAASAAPAAKEWAVGRRSSPARPGRDARPAARQTRFGCAPGGSSAVAAAWPWRFPARAHARIPGRSLSARLVRPSRRDPMLFRVVVGVRHSRRLALIDARTREEKAPKVSGQRARGTAAATQRTSYGRERRKHA